MTNALSCYVRDKLPPCSLFLLILKIVLTFFPSMNHWIELRGRRLIRAVHYWKYRLFFFEKEKKKVSLSFEQTGERFDYHELSCYTAEKATVSLQSYETNRTVNVSRLGKEINRVYRERAYIAWLIARGQIFIMIYKMYAFKLILFELLSLSINFCSILYFTFDFVWVNAISSCHKNSLFYIVIITTWLLQSSLLSLIIRSIFRYKFKWKYIHHMAYTYI